MLGTAKNSNPTAVLNAASSASLSSRTKKGPKGVIAAAALKLFMGILIILNVALTIIATDASAVQGAEVPVAVQIALQSTLFCFFVEMVVRVINEGRTFLESGMNIFDMLVVCIDVVIEIISLVGSSDLPSISVFRVLRAARLIRAIGYLSNYRELYLMLHGLASAMKAILWAGFLIAVVTTLFSIVAVELIHPLNMKIAASGQYEQCARCPLAYATVGHAFLTFISSILAGDSWGQTTMPIMEQYPLTIPFFIIVLFSINLGLLNLILAVIVERAQEAREEDIEHKRKEKEHMMQQCKSKLLQLFMSMDADGDQALSKEELRYGIKHNETFSTIMHVMDMGSDDMNVVFAMMDTDQDGLIDCHEFVDQLFKMRTQDSQTLLLFIKHVVSQIRVEVVTFAEMKGKIDTIMSALDRSELDAESTMHRNTPALLIPSQPELCSSILPDAISDGFHVHPRTLQHLDESWCDWRQWEVTKEESTHVCSQEKADDFRISTCGLDAMKKQIDEDLTALTRDIQRPVDGTTLSCNMVQPSISHQGGNEVQDIALLSHLAMHADIDHPHGVEQHAYSNLQPENMEHALFHRMHFERTEEPDHAGVTPGMYSLSAVL